MKFKLSGDAIAVGLVLLGALVAAIVAFGRESFFPFTAPFPLPEPAPAGGVTTRADFRSPGFACPPTFQPTVLGYDPVLVGPVSLQFDTRLRFIDPATGCVIANRPGLAAMLPLLPLTDVVLREAFAIANPHLARELVFN